MMEQQKDAPSHQGRVLLVGDDPERRKSLKRVLESCGLEVAEAAPGAEADRKADELALNGVIVDPVVADMPLAEVERRYILRVLDKEGGHVARAARKLGIPRSSLYQRLKNYGVNLARRGGPATGTDDQHREAS